MLADRDDRFLDVCQALPIVATHNPAPARVATGTCGLHRRRRREAQELLGVPVDVATPDYLQARVGTPGFS